MFREKGGGIFFSGDGDRLEAPPGSPPFAARGRRTALIFGGFRRLRRREVELSDLH